MKKNTAALCLIAPILSALAAAPASKPAGIGAVRVYIGTYTSGESRGIYRLRLDTASGALAPEGEPTPAVDPSFLALSPDGARLYAVNETGQSRTDPPGAVSAFAVNATTGALRLLNQQASGGAAPCHLSLDAAGRHVLVANYWGGNAAVFALEKDGRIGARTALVAHQGENPTPRDPGPHVHSVDVDPTGRRVLSADLGLDTLFVYGFDPARGMFAARPARVALPSGSGPRHLAFHPGGRHVYVINELNSTITVFAYDAASGSLESRQTISTLPDGFSGENSTAEVAVSADGRFLYGSNRGHDSIAMFSIDAATGELKPLGHQSSGGRHPRHFAIDPSGAFLLVANRDSDNIAVFRRADDGRLQPVGEPTRVPRPVCVLMRRVGP